VRGRAKANVPFVRQVKKFCAVGFFIFSAAWLSALFRLAVADNVLQLQEVGDFEAQNCQPSTNFDRSTMLHLTT
jgi:hypothetical protein